MNATSRRSVLLAFALFSVLPGCERKATPPGTRRGVARIVSISPSTTEALFAIGAGDRVVGRSRYCDHPPAVLALPQVGGYVDPSFEAILALSPDLVVGARGPIGTALTDRLGARGIRTYFPKTESFEEIDAMLLGLGAETGHEDGARVAVDALHAELRRVERSVAKRARVRALVVFGISPLSVAGPHSFADEMLKRAGADNVVTEGGAYPMLGVEHVLVLDPDVIVHASMEGARGPRLDETTPGWARVRAVKEKRVRMIADETVLRPGPRIGAGLRALASALGPLPDLSGDEDASP